MEEDSNQPLLKVSGLRTHFHTEEGVVKAVDGVDFYVHSGEILGLVGESGCGKSVTALSILRLIRKPGRIVEGEIEFEGRDLLDLSTAEMNDLRGNRISIIFQQPQTSLNPVLIIGNQIAEVFRLHTDMGKDEAWGRTVDLLHQVGIPDPEQRAHAYPHEMSGGQAQRAMIAMALALQPQLLIADEPTTALDVTIQAQILDLILELNQRTGAAVILITHDLGVVAEMADRIAVMYAGQVVEHADVKTLFAQPLHPYTKGLIASIPVLGNVKDRLAVIPGNVPNLIDLGPGCRFAERCDARREHELSICSQTDPELRPTQANEQHPVRCWLYHDHEDHQAPLKLNMAEQAR